MGVYTGRYIAFFVLTALGPKSTNVHTAAGELFRLYNPGTGT